MRYIKLFVINYRARDPLVNFALRITKKKSLCSPPPPSKFPSCFSIIPVLAKLYIRYKPRQIIHPQERLCRRVYVCVCVFVISFDGRGQTLLRDDKITNARSLARAQSTLSALPQKDLIIHSRLFLLCVYCPHIYSAIL